RESGQTPSLPLTDQTMERPMADANLIAIPAASKYCTKCSTTKPINEFYQARSRNRLQCHCKTCQNIVNRANGYTRNPKNERRNRLWQRFGMTEADYDPLLDMQRASDLVCRRTSNDRRLIGGDRNCRSGC